MSALQKSIMKSKLPPRCPRSYKQKLAPFGMSRCKNYQPESWKRFFHRTEDVETDGGTFRVYLTAEPDHPLRPRIVTLHGGGYSGLSWALFAEEVTYMVHCQVISIDIRGHGETQAKDPDDMSAETLVKDVEQVLQKLFGDEMPPLILVGHSMGGAIAVRAAHLPSLQHYVQGLVVIDVVEGTAMEALASMQSFLRGRPTHFKSIRHAIEWCVRSGQVRNVSSARVSMPSQIVNVETGLLATRELEDMSVDDSEADGAPLARADSIAEEDEPPESPDDLEPEPEPARVKHDEPVFVKPSEDLNVETGLLATRELEDMSVDDSEADGAPLARADSIAEEDEPPESPDELEEPEPARVKHDEPVFVKPSEDLNVETGLLATRELEDMSVDDSEADGAPLARADSIAEEDEPPESPDDLEPEPEPARVKHDEPVFVKPSEDLKRYKWRIDLSGTERHWAGWFRGLSALFLSAPAPRLLLLASIDGLDRELTVGQMQGKFQMQVLTRCGHAVHEDTPEEVARVVAAFALRHRLTSATESGENMNLVAAPGC
ncbi:protein phosphatase methylesterase 1 [Ostrinia nubilalis]|uniref:protein phosphatase methylesterase 1 n=1 Tax=Ostrinia nubilalis TaxID=29057 RepID=UPI0030825D7E